MLGVENESLPVNDLVVDNLPAGSLLANDKFIGCPISSIYHLSLLADGLPANRLLADNLPVNSLPADENFVPDLISSIY